MQSSNICASLGLHRFNPADCERPVELDLLVRLCYNQIIQKTLPKPQLTIFGRVTVEMMNRAPESFVYCVSPDLALEHFGDKSIILLAMQDRLLTVNKAAAVLLELIMTTFEGQSFLDEELSTLLTQHYHLTKAKAQEEVRRILTSWSEQGILVAVESDIDTGGLA
jgi:hypothetical protein